MARMARVIIPDCPHHVTQRGVRSMNVFSNDLDKVGYLRLLRANSEIHGVSILAYCLMTNHIHLVAVPKSTQALSRAIGETHRLYTKSINERIGAKGYLFQGRFYSCPMDTRHAINSAAYIELNPVRAGMVDKPWEYRWSSAAFHTGIVKKDPVIEERGFCWSCREWKEFISRPVIVTEAEKVCFRTGRPLGDSEFIAKAEQISGRVLRPQPAGRKPAGRWSGEIGLVSPD
jgi:putative transposase